MKKKESIKEKRQREEAEKRAKYQKAEQLKHQELQQQQNVEVIAKKEEFVQTESNLIINKKSKAKAAGLKSVFILGDNHLLMTSFGNGAKAVLEKEVVGNEITDLDKNLTVETADMGFNVSGRIVQNASVDNPLEVRNKVKAGEDLIHCKDQLEKLYFGQTFQDNIHIQLIYSIMDIEKILTVHINNVIYELENLARSEDNSLDLISNLSLGGYESYKDLELKKDKKEKAQQCFERFHQIVDSGRLGYFGNTFAYPKKDKKNLKNAEEIWEKQRQEYYNKCYNAFLCLAKIRQGTTHGKSTLKYLYPVDNTLDENLKCFLDKMYSERIRHLNKGFLKNSKNDINCLIHAYHYNQTESKDKIINLQKEYYQFVVLKEVKNQGFSIKHIREIILSDYAPTLLSDKYDSFRAKMNRFIDFVIYKWYQEAGDTISLVEKLRASTNDAEKEYCYRAEAKTVWTAIQNIVLSEIVPLLDPKVWKQLSDAEHDQTVSDESMKDVFIPETASVFTELMYLVTTFLDGKEINDLLTQLINKFENIQSFMDVIKEASGEETIALKSDFQLFNESEKIAQELRLVNSFARMSESDESTKRIMFMEAAQLLGYVGDDESLKSYVDDWLKDPKGKDNTFRNFIINNVITSDRFRYLVRYGDPKQIRKLAVNKDVMGFVLRQIPEAQIKRYYDSYKMSKTDVDYNIMIEELTDVICKLNFADYMQITKEFNNRYNSVQKEREKALVRLYLTALYLLQKNLVYINSRYYLAFHCAERDGEIYDSQKYRIDDIPEKDRRVFAINWLKENSKNNRARRYIQQNIDNSNTYMVNKFRNCTAHMTVVRNASEYIGDLKKPDSYFEIYHYIVQRYLDSIFDRNIIKTDEDKRECEAMLRYFENVEKYHSYSKDFVKAYNVAFAYNLPRYKNLSIKELFDRNNYNPNAKTAMHPEE